MSEQHQNQELELQIIDSYTRKQAIADGVLIDIEKEFPGLSNQAGFKFPVALTAKALNRYVELNPNAKKALEDPTGRMWDVLWMLMLKIKLTRKQRLDTLKFSFLCTVPDDPEPFAIETDPPSEEDDDDFLSLEEMLERAKQKKQHQLCWLKAIISPDEEGNGCITVMLPWED